MYGSYAHDVLLVSSVNNLPPSPPWIHRLVGDPSPLIYLGGSYLDVLWVMIGFGFVPTNHQHSYDLINPSKADLSGKYVLVTGASRGIGRAIALSYAKAGVSGIAILARTDLSSFVPELLEAAAKAATTATRSNNRTQTPIVLCLIADITDISAVKAAADTVAETFGQVDILINNAGYLETFSPVIDSDPDEWWRSFEVNVKGVYLMAKMFLPLVLASQDKTIIAISSIGAHLTAPGASGYQTTKLAVLRLNSFLMAEYGDQGLIAYGCHPGGVMTDLARKMPDVYHQYLADDPELAGDTLVYLTRTRRDWLADRYVDVTWDMGELFQKKDIIVRDDLLKVRLRV